jgi:ATP-dependent Clp protease ATP-binding subunit ClpX
MQLFKMDETELEFEQEAIETIAKLAMERKMGARGLRSILESFMLDIMYEIPSDETIQKVIITKQTVEKTTPATFIHKETEHNEADDSNHIEEFKDAV